MNIILKEIPTSQINIWKLYEIQEQTNHPDKTIEVNIFTPIRTTSVFQSHIRNCMQNSGANNNSSINPSNNEHNQMSHDP